MGATEVVTEEFAASKEMKELVEVLIHCRAGCMSLSKSMHMSYADIHVYVYMHPHTRTYACVHACTHIHTGCSCYEMLPYVTRSRKRGPFPQKSDCELDLSADSTKSVVHVRENRLTLAHITFQSYSPLSIIHTLTLVSTYQRLFQSCRQAHVGSVYYRK